MSEALKINVTRILRDISTGNKQAFDQLLPVVYNELKVRAHRQRSQWYRDYTLNTSALIHEAYIKLVDQDKLDWKNRTHFLEAAAQAMRHILIDYARQQSAQKRGGRQAPLSLDDMVEKDSSVIELSEERAESLINLDEALKRLSKVSLRECKVVEYRFFGGMTVAETASALGISTATVKRDWLLAQAWLYNEMRVE